MRRMIAVAALIMAALVATGCEDSSTPTSSDQQRKQSVKARADTFSRAEAKYPLPRTENFPLRKMLVEMTKREDLPNHPWYVYVLADTGNVIGYYVAKTVPINACNFLSSTEDVKKTEDNYEPGFTTDVLTAPSIDGIYYGNSACNTMVFEDYSTNAIIKLGDVKYFVADKPLNLDAEAIKVKR